MPYYLQPYKTSFFPPFPLCTTCLAWDVANVRVPMVGEYVNAGRYYFKYTRTVTVGNTWGGGAGVRTGSIAVAWNHTYSNQKLTWGNKTTDSNWSAPLDFIIYYDAQKTEVLSGRTFTVTMPVQLRFFGETTAYAATSVDLYEYELQSRDLVSECLSDLDYLWLLPFLSDTRNDYPNGRFEQIKPRGAYQALCSSGFSSSGFSLPEHAELTAVRLARAKFPSLHVRKTQTQYQMDDQGDYIATIGTEVTEETMTLECGVNEFRPEPWGLSIVSLDTI